MKTYKIGLVAVLAMLVLPEMASASSDMYLKIEGSKGETQIVHCPAGACVVAPLEAGTYSVHVSDAEGKVIATEIMLKYSIVSPRDAASGQASGKRMHKPLMISKQLARGAKPANVIEIDEAGAQLAIGVTDEAVDTAQAKVTKTRSNIQNN